MTAGDDEATGNRDVVLVTIDCWRHDALRWMPNVQRRIDADEYDAAEAVCAAPSTRGAFASIFAGQHYPHVYNGFDDVRDGVESLGAVLSGAGYATGGFVGSNPFLSAWESDFDEFWNDGLDITHESRVREGLRRVVSTLRNATNYLRIRGRVSADTVAARARDWYRSRSSPRFLWMHLMDPHIPFLPGTMRGLDAGPLSVYRAHWRFKRDPDALTDDDRKTLRECYRLSVEYLDTQVGAVLDFVDDNSLVILMGDHGEEFDHGAYGHARLYDETVRVPLLSRGVPAITDGDLVRQIDVAPTVLSSLDLRIPDRMSGLPHDGSVRDAFMLNHSPQMGNLYAGLRTDRYKIVRTMDAETDEVVRHEVYDLVADPAERVDLYDEREFSDLVERLDSFLDVDGIREGIRESSRESAPAVVEDRLKALGYK